MIDQDYQTNGYVGDVAFADFRHTGLPDFVAIGAIEWGTNYIAYAKNNGDGTFTPLPLATPAGAQGMIGVGDFNGDGKLDLVVVNPWAGPNQTALTVFLGNGDGTFTPGYSTTFAGSAGQVWVGDFNGDGKPDVLVHLATNGMGTISKDVLEFLGKGDGTFAPVKDVLPNFGDMAVGDLNHEGTDDIVELVEPLTDLDNYIPLQYAVYLGQPDGSFKLANTYQPYSGFTAPYTLNDGNGVTLADFNGDGNLDIAVFQTETIPPPGGNPDLAHTFLQIMEGNGDGTFTPTYTVFDFDQILVPQLAADLAGDGKAELVELAAVNGSFQVVPSTVGPALQVRIVSTPIVGSTSTAQVTLAAASSADTTIQLAASDPAISIPASVTIPAGSVSQEVPFQIGSGFNSQRVFTINAALGAQTATAYGWQAGSSLAVGFTLYIPNSSETAYVGQATPDYGMGVFSIDNYSTTVHMSCSGLPTWAACQFGAPVLTISAGSVGSPSLVVTTTSAAQVGTYQFTVIATDGTFTQQGAAALQVQASPPPAIQGVISPSSATISAGQSTGLEITILSQYGAAGSLSLQCSSNPSGTTCAFNPATATLPANGSATGQLTLQVGSSVPDGSYTFNVVATVGSLTSQIPVTLQVQSPDFSGTIGPGSEAVPIGESTNFSINLTSLNGESGAVSFQCSNLPSGVTCAFTPASPTLPIDGSLTEQLSVQASSAAQTGNYPLTVSATIGNLTHQFSATLEIEQAPGFTGSITPGSTTLSVGQSANFTIGLNSQSGASGNVSFQCLNAPTGTACTFNPTTANLPANGNVSDTLTVQVNSKPALAPPLPSIPWTPTIGWLGTLSIVACVFFATFIVMATRKRKLAPLAVLSIIAASILFTAVSCGGGGSQPSGPAPPSPVTFMITVQASGAGINTPQNVGTVTITVE